VQEDVEDALVDVSSIVLDTSDIQVRTNIDIDDKLIAEAMELMSVRTKKKAVEDALREAVERGRAAKAIRNLRGKIHWEGDLAWR
jgi:Arc/MetJ family transcription regulator